MIISIACVAGAIAVLTVDDPGYAQNTKSKSGLNFNVPEDWPIEKRGGILGPIPTEEYMVIKFTEVEEEFQVIKADSTTKIEELQLRIDSVEGNLTEEIQKAQALAEDQGGAGEDLNNVLTRLTLLESEIRRLDQKITKKVAVMKSLSGNTARTIKSLEEKVEELQFQNYKLDGKIDYIFEQQEIDY